MFDWFWKFLYGISKSLFHLVDGVMGCANKLCGIEPIYVDGEATDFLTYLLSSDNVLNSFKVAVLLSIILIVFFTILAIIRAIAKNKIDETPGKIVMKAVKYIISFMFVWVIMITVTSVINLFAEAIYKVTMDGASSLGSFMFVCFADDAWTVSGSSLETAKAQFLNGSLNYYSTGTVKGYIELDDFDYIGSWLAGGVVLFTLASTLGVFVEKAMALVMLMIAAPFSISASILDDGARFKLWRDQVLVKYLTSYGIIIGINIYIMILGIIVSSNVSFFPDSHFLDKMLKLLVMICGALSLKKSMALLGNLISSGAGSNELREASMLGGGAGGLARMALGAAGKGLGMAGSLGKGALNAVGNARRLPGKVGSWAKFNFGKNEDNKGAEQQASMVESLSAIKEALVGGKNDNKPEYNDKKDDNKMKDILKGGGDDKKDNPLANMANNANKGGEGGGGGGEGGGGNKF